MGDYITLIKSSFWTVISSRVFKLDFPNLVNIGLYLNSRYPKFGAPKFYHLGATSRKVSNNSSQICNFDPEDLESWN